MLTWTPQSNNISIYVEQCFLSPVIYMSNYTHLALVWPQPTNQLDSTPFCRAVWCDFNCPLWLEIGFIKRKPETYCNCAFKPQTKRTRCHGRYVWPVCAPFYARGANRCGTDKGRRLPPPQRWHAINGTNMALNPLRAKQTSLSSNQTRCTVPALVTMMYSLASLKALFSLSFQGLGCWLYWSPALLFIWACKGRSLNKGSGSVLRQMCCESTTVS